MLTFLATAMRIDLEQRLRDRRVNFERRSGQDTHSAEEREFSGEPQLNPDRRSGLDRRSRKQPGHRSIFLYIVVAAGALLVDVYFFDGRHSTDIVQTMARELNTFVIRWIAPAFPGG